MLHFTSFGPGLQALTSSPCDETSSNNSAQPDKTAFTVLNVCSDIYSNTYST